MGESEQEGTAEMTNTAQQFTRHRDGQQEPFICPKETAHNPCFSYQGTYSALSAPVRRGIADIV